MVPSQHSRRPLHPSAQSVHRVGSSTPPTLPIRLAPVARSMLLDRGVASGGGSQGGQQILLLGHQEIQKAVPLRERTAKRKRKRRYPSHMVCFISLLPLLGPSTDSNVLIVRTTSYILRRFRKSPPSLVLHLHPTHFRFDQQDGSFSYNSPMKILLEHIRSQTVPHDMIEDLHHSGVKFYDGMIRLKSPKNGR